MQRILELKLNNGAEWYIPAVCVEAVAYFNGKLTLITRGGQELEDVAGPPLHEILAAMADPVYKRPEPEVIPAEPAEPKERKFFGHPIKNPGTYPKKDEYGNQVLDACGQSLFHRDG